MDLVTIVAVSIVAIMCLAVVVLYCCLAVAGKYDEILDEIAEKMADETMNRFEEFLDKED